MKGAIGVIIALLLGFVLFLFLTGVGFFVRTCSTNRASVVYNHGYDYLYFVCSSAHGRKG